MGRRILVFFKDIRHFTKDLILLVSGIYLALWMENKVQDWQEQEYQQSYYQRLTDDVELDIRRLQELKTLLQDKSEELEQGIEIIQSGNLKEGSNDAQKLSLELSGIVNSYHFFSPQNFTYLSMRESGDFKLIGNQQLKTRLIKLYSNYKVLLTLQSNYRQGLDEEFIPYWIRRVDLLQTKALDQTMLHQSFFTNMIAFAWNETQQRKKYVDRTLEEAKQVRNLIAAELINKV